jgi:hypothetical protein
MKFLQGFWHRFRGQVCHELLATFLPYGSKTCASRSISIIFSAVRPFRLIPASFIPGPNHAGTLSHNLDQFLGGRSRSSWPGTAASR